ncbi:MAG TPA: hypothetical protein VKE91_00485 [Blastocatellia bacterium]|nr:hypothetical protein [Blastocatellia bacterium]
MAATIQEFIEKNRITMHAEPTDHNPTMTDAHPMDHWRVTLHVNRRRMMVVFSQGSGFNGAAPELGQVLDCLASDASGAEGRDFEEWASDYGYDSDSRTAERTYDAIVTQMRQLGHLLGPDAYAELLHDTERL